MLSQNVAMLQSAFGGTVLQSGGGGGGGGSVFLIVMLLIWLVVLAAMWKIFTKAGQPGWAALIPIYNAYVLLQIIGRPAWWLVLFLIPFVNFIISLIVAIDLAKAFGKGTGFGLGMAFFPIIFYPLLGFGSAQYQGAPN